ncbi:MAG: dienelactone hydrolase family protein [Verrucomicrobia bacterium]|nr:dienelactone hydrolase family protein [Verrucomicrobiota bacterium]
MNTTTLPAWQQRRRELRRILWDLLTAGPMKRPKVVKPRTLFRGVAAERRLRDMLQKYARQFPRDSFGPRMLNYRFPGPVTWDTSIVSYPGWPGEPPQRAVLRVPRNLKEPAPAILCVHGHAVGCQLGKETIEEWALPLTARGFVTLAPDAVRFGERRDRTLETAEIRDWKGMSFYSERLLAMPLALEGKCMLGAMTWENMCAVDVLRTLPFVDPKRIGCIGGSMGGIQTYYLAAMDDRIQCAVTACSTHSFRVWGREETLAALFCYIPHVLRYTDAGEIFSLIAPRPLLCIDGARDGFFPVEGVRRTSAEIKQTYRLCRALDRFRHIIHRGGHDVGKEHTTAAWEWMERWLKPARPGAGADVENGADYRARPPKPRPIPD